MKLGYLKSEFEKNAMERYKPFKLDSSLTEIGICALVAPNGVGALVKADKATALKAEGFIFEASPLDPYGRGDQYNVNPTFANAGVREYRKLGMIRKGFAVLNNNNGDRLGTYWRMVDEDLTGTVATTSGSTAVVGTSTTFTTSLKVGDYITIATVPGVYQVATIADDTHLTLSANASATASGKVVTAKNMYGKPLYLADNTVDIQVQTLKPTSNIQVVGRIEHTDIIEFDIDIVMN